MADTVHEFNASFEALTGHPPFPWQAELFHEWFKQGRIPSSCNLPTGLGKTSVIAIWLIALANDAKVPRRLVYVVNRRTVVDQTTVEVENFRNRLKDPDKYAVNPDSSEQNSALKWLASQLARKCVNAAGSPLAISTLRGQFADNREWSADPSRPAVTCGTVDMIGSRLLFSGYGIGFRSRPLHAGFLGQDALLVHDEAHLEPAFQKLIETVQEEQSRCGDLRPLQVMQLTATMRNSNGQAAQPFALTPGDHEHPVVRQRIEARKELSLTSVEDDKQVAGRIAEIAAGHKDANAAVLVFARTLGAVTAIEKELVKTKRKVVLLTGTMRGKERDGLVEKPEFRQFLKGAEPGETVYLVCTSAGEVGIDISADHMVCDLSTFESMGQRFGRVNRFGEPMEHVAHIDVVHPRTFDEKDKLTPARQATLKLLKQLNGDGSPAALARLDADERKAAFAPEPTILPATDILFDAWALTTIRDRMPGRPPVAPYLHGIADWEPPQTQVAWREEVDVLDTDELRERYKPEDLLDDYPLKPHELLRDTSERVLAALDVMAGRMGNDCPIWLVGERGEVDVMSLKGLLEADKKRVISRIRDCTILLPPSIGGLRNGMLKGESGTADDVSSVLMGPDGHLQRWRGWNDEALINYNMRLVRSIVFESQGEDERRTWDWYAKPVEGGRTAQKPVKLDVHVGDVQRAAQRIVGGLALSEEIADAVVLAAKLHDQGKGRQSFQVTLGNRDYPAVLLAKSGRKGARLPEPFRHEFASLADAATDPQVEKLAPLMRDLVLHLIAAHHGRARPHFSVDEAFDPERPTADAEALAVETPRRFARLQRQYGRWGLAYLESLLRAADWTASANPSAVVVEDKEALA